MNASGGSSALRNLDSEQSQPEQALTQPKQSPEKIFSLTELRDLVFAREDRVRKILSSGKELHLCADELLLELRRLISKETARLDLAEGLSQFAHRFYAEPSATAVMADLVNSLERVSRDGANGAKQLGAKREAQFRTDIQELFSEFFRWYAARLQSFAALEIERRAAVQSGKLTEAEARKDGVKEQIFNLTIIHDQIEEGMRGLIVEFGLKITRSAGERYWSRVSLREPGKDILCRAGWESWSDLSQRTVGAKPKFASILPVFVDQQRFILDRIRQFIPYDALDLPSGEQRCEIRVTLFNESRENVSSVKQHRFIPSSPLAALSTPIESPQSRECWSRDPVSNSSVTGLRVSRRGLEAASPMVAFNFDLEICDDYPNLGSLYLSELRILNSAGERVGALDPRLADEAQRFRASFDILPTRSIQRFFYREIELPVSALDLKPGTHELRAELLLFGPKDELLCGSSLSFTLDIPAALTHHSDRLLIQRIRNEGVFTSSQPSA